mmetsp:Transcript_26585/g.62242  ORF Transcript_26585/g.62242 Transcript_26585/m.62242 type:complete len:213 (-) Transcript_26585:66-704(-)
MMATCWDETGSTGSVATRAANEPSSSAWRSRDAKRGTTRADSCETSCATLDPANTEVVMPLTSVLRLPRKSLNSADSVSARCRRSSRKLLFALNSSCWRSSVLRRGRTRDVVSARSRRSSDSSASRTPSWTSTGLRAAVAASSMTVARESCWFCAASRDLSLTSKAIQPSSTRDCKVKARPRCELVRSCPCLSRLAKRSRQPSKLSFASFSV